MTKQEFFDETIELLLAEGLGKEDLEVFLMAIIWEYQVIFGDGSDDFNQSKKRRRK